MNPPSPTELLDLVEGRRGHFRMESGFHSELWFELDRLFRSPERLHPFVRALAGRLKLHDIEAVCGPETGGAKLAAMIAAELGVPAFSAIRVEAPPEATGRLFPVRYVIADEQRSRLRGRAVAVVDDAISAGSAVRGTLADLLACEAQPRTIGALFIFGDAAARFATDRGLTLEGVLRMPFGMWKPGECPLCAAGAPLENVSDTPAKT